MTKTKKDNQSNPAIHDLGIVDLILIDHQFLKECIETLSDEKAKKSKKLSTAKEFLEALSVHSQAEKKTVYSVLESNEEFHFNILQAEVEHGIVDQKVKSIKAQLTGARSLNDEVGAELKVLSDLVKHHIMEEESELLPRMQKLIDDESLNEIGINFMKIRKFTARDLKDYPQLQDELIQWKDSIQKVSSEFLTKMDKFVENLQH